MPLKYLIDEHLRGAFSKSLIAAGLAQGHRLDVWQVGDGDAPPLGTKDPGLLTWCARGDRILISRDKSSLPDHLAAFLATGQSSPGIFVIRPNAAWHDVLDDLVLMSQASLPNEFRDRIVYIPL
jgi:hypothetical protein